MVITFLSSAALFGIAVFPYSPWWNDPTPEPSIDTSQQGLNLLTNDPHAEFKIHYKFNSSSNPDGALTAVAFIDFMNIGNEESFRWALVGSGKMRFQARLLEVEDGDIAKAEENLPEWGEPGFGEFPLISPQKWTPRYAQDCTPGQVGPLEGTSILFGNNQQVNLLESSGKKRFASGHLAIILRFPEIVATTSFTGEEWEIGPINDSRKSVHLGSREFHFDDCITIMGEKYKPTISNKYPVTADLYPSKLTSYVKDAHLVASVPPSTPFDNKGSWTSLESLTIHASFESATMLRIKETLIFLAAILGGIGASLLVALFTISIKQR